MFVDALRIFDRNSNVCSYVCLCVWTMHGKILTCQNNLNDIMLFILLNSLKICKTCNDDYTKNFVITCVAKIEFDLFGSI